MSKEDAERKISALRDCGFRCLDNGKNDMAYVWFMAAWNLRARYGL